MTRVAIAGTGGLAQLIAKHIMRDTSHIFILLSRAVSCSFAREPHSIQSALVGIDVLISTIPGQVQFKLIDAAVSVDVRRFIPAQFQGAPSRIVANSISDANRMAVLRYLERPEHRRRLQYTVIVCGILYERFAPGGLRASLMGAASGIGYEGGFLVGP
ncbi:hypothetical protein MRB53_037518 [Persea americana]|nr:hypothetical protein MRB53_037518 [Persea americana]